MQGTCRTCRFRDPDTRPEYEGAGHCRRYPPSVAEHVTFDGSGNNHFSQLWPWMHATDWCGEYRLPEKSRSSLVSDVLTDHRDGMSLRKLASKHGVGVGVIRGILGRQAPVTHCNPSTKGTG